MSSPKITGRMRKTCADCGSVIGLSDRTDVKVQSCGKCGTEYTIQRSRYGQNINLVKKVV
jgi:ribosomal protein S27AE